MFRSGTAELVVPVAERRVGPREVVLVRHIVAAAGRRAVRVVINHQRARTQILLPLVERDRAPRRSRAADRRSLLHSPGAVPRLRLRRLAWPWPALTRAGNGSRSEPLPISFSPGGAGGAGACAPRWQLRFRASVTTLRQAWPRRRRSAAREVRI